MQNYNQNVTNDCVNLHLNESFSFDQILLFVTHIVRIWLRDCSNNLPFKYLSNWIIYYSDDELKELDYALHNVQFEYNEHARSVRKMFEYSSTRTIFELIAPDSNHGGVRIFDGYSPMLITCHGRWSLDRRKSSEIPPFPLEIVARRRTIRNDAIWRPLERHVQCYTILLCASTPSTGHLRNRNDLTLWVGTCR